MLFGVDFTSLHISRSLEEETQAKRSRNTGFPTNIRYPDIDDSIVGESAVELEADETGIDIADTPKDKGKGVARDPPQGLLDELEESPNISTPGSSKTSRNSLPIVTPARNKNMLPTTSPRVYPLPESPNGSDDSSLNESPVLPPTGSPTNFLSPSANRNGKNPSIARSEAMVKRYAILNIKAYEYTELTFRPASEKKIAAELDAIYSKENRFDPQEAALLEEEFQRKVRIVHDRKAEEEFREAEMEREEQERIRTIEAAKKAAEEQKRREQAERARKEQEQIEKKRAEEETIKAQAEQKRKEAAEAKRQADEKARLEREAKDKANKEQAAAKAAADATAQAQAAQAAQAAQVAQAAQPQQQAPTQPTPSTPLIQQPLVPGRKSFANDSANVKRVITNLKGLKKLGDQFLKESGLKQLRRDMIPKLGQLTGQKQQTIIVVSFQISKTLNELKLTTDMQRDAIKSMLLEAMNIQSPSAPLSQYVFTAPSSDVGVQVGYIWIVNELAKMAVGQILSECLSSHELADPVGVVIASIFADPKFAVGGKSLIDIFIARFCKRCPILLGEFGPCLTKGDRVRLGWKVEEDGEIRESESSYTERMQAYTAGFVALAGRFVSPIAGFCPY